MSTVWGVQCSSLFLEAFSNGVGEIYRQIGATIYIDDILIYIYIDDILIYGKNFWQHMVNLAQVFQALTEAHLRVKIEKMLSSDFSWSLQLLPEIYQGFLKDC